jgi:hypothetical protein
MMWCYALIDNGQNTRWKNVALTKHKMKMIMLSYEKIKMTFKNKQQEEQETRWRPYTCIKTQKTP